MFSPDVILTRSMRNDLYQIADGNIARRRAKGKEDNFSTRDLEYSLVEYALFQRLAYKQKHQGIPEREHNYLYEKARIMSIEATLNVSSGINEKELVEEGIAKRELEEHTITKLFQRIYSSTLEKYVADQEEKELRALNNL